MKANVVFTAVATKDLASALPWYESLFGRPPDVIPNDNEVMWEVCRGAWMYLIQDQSRAGHAVMTISVPVLNDALNEIADRGLPIPAIEVIGEAGRKASLVDPEGNTIAIIEVVESQ